MKIIHLSDTHLGRDNNSERFDLLVQSITALGNPHGHIIIHTGDLIDQGNEQQRELGAGKLAAFTQQGWRVLLAPGNHDCGNAAQVDPAMARHFLEKFADFIFASQPRQFPVLHLTDQCAFIGLDSNQGEMGWLTRWFAEGNLGDAQIDALSAMLDSPELQNKFKVIYLHHHPFFDSYVVAPDVDDGHFFSHMFGWNTRRFRRLKDAYTLMQCVRDRVDVMLFGHQHYGLDYSAEARRYGVKIALDGSSSTCTEMDTDRMHYRVIDTTTQKITTHMVMLPKA